MFLFKYSSADLKSLAVRPAAPIKTCNRARNKSSLSIIAIVVRVVGHGLSPTILLEFPERFKGAVAGRRYPVMFGISHLPRTAAPRSDRCCRFRATLTRSFVP